MSNSDNGIDAGTQWHLDQGGSEPTVEAWRDIREHVTEHSGDDDNWKARHAEDREQATRAAYDEVASRDRDRSDWDEARPHRDWMRERWPAAKLGDYINDKLGWHSYFQRDPTNAAEQWTRMWHRQPPFHPRAKTTPKAEPPPDLHRDGLVEWERLQAVKDALATAGHDRNDETDFTTTADLRALVRERTGLTLNQFLEKCRDIDEASLENPAAVAHRFSTFSGAPATERHAQDIVNVAVREAKVAGANEFLDGLRRDQRLPPDYDALENDIGDKLEFMNANGMRTDNPEADLDTAIRWARDTAIARQQQADAANPPSMMDYSLRSLDPGVANEVAVARARKASRSVTGSPTLPDQGPATKARPGMSYDEDLAADAMQAYHEAAGR